MPFPYNEYTLQERQAISSSMKKRYPRLHPILVNMIGRDLQHRKYLVPGESTMAKLLCSIRRQNNFSPEEGLFLFVNDHLVTLTKSVSGIASRHTHPDGFIYVVIAVENTFGEVC